MRMWAAHANIANAASAIDPATIARWFICLTEGADDGSAKLRFAWAPVLVRGGNMPPPKEALAPTWKRFGWLNNLASDGLRVQSNSDAGREELDNMDVDIDGNGWRESTAFADTSYVAYRERANCANIGEHTV
jgi:hypothetical protein